MCVFCELVFVLKKSATPPSHVFKKTRSISTPRFRLVKANDMSSQAHTTCYNH